MCRICGKSKGKMFGFELKKPKEQVVVCGDCVDDIVVQQLEHGMSESEVS